MNTILYELGDVKIVVYLDDIIVFGETIEEHNRNLLKVLTVLRKYNLKLEPEKCHLLKEKLKYLGHIVDKDGMRPTKDNVQAIRDMKRPQTVKDVRSFMGSVNFYGKFIPNVADLRKPLNDLLKKDHKFVWTNECDKAFNKLRYT